jgi:hypothetical protein
MKSSEACADGITHLAIGLKTGEHATDAKRDALEAKEDTYRDVDTSFYKINADQTVSAVGYHTFGEWRHMLMTFTST